MRSYSFCYTFEQIEEEFKTCAETPTLLNKSIRYDMSRPHTHHSFRNDNHRLASHKLVLTAKTEARKLREKRVREKLAVENQTRNEIKVRLLRLFQMESAAITIQKHIRGFLVRKTYDKIFVEAGMMKIHKSIDDLRVLSLNCYYNSGGAASEAAQRIKDAYRRYKARVKFYKIREVFRNLVNHRKEIAEFRIRNALPCFSAMIRVKKERKERERLQKIEDFRRRKAISTIRKFYIKNGMSYKLFMKKISIFKQKLEQFKLKRAIISLVSRLNLDERMLKKAASYKKARSSRCQSPIMTVCKSRSRASSPNPIIQPVAFSPKSPTSIFRARGISRIPSRTKANYIPQPSRIFVKIANAASKLIQAEPMGQSILNLAETEILSRPGSPSKESIASVQAKEEQADMLYDALEDIYKTKLEQSKTSYGIRELKLTKIKPILSKEEIELDILPSEFSLFPLFGIRNGGLDRMKPIMPNTPKKDTLNETMVRSRTKRKPTVCVEESSYMRFTQATKHRFEPEDARMNKDIRFIKCSNRLLSTTITHSNKRRIHSKSMKEDKKPFTVAARKDAEFPPPKISMMNKRSSKIKTSSAGIDQDSSRTDLNQSYRTVIRKPSPFHRCFRAPLFEYKRIRLGSAGDSKSYYQDFI